KIRTVGGNLVTLPNMKFTDGVVENLSTRPWVRRIMNLTLACDTPPAKVEEALSIIKHILADPEIAAEINIKDLATQVFLTDYHADNLNIAVTYWYASDTGNPARRTYQVLADHIHLRVMQSFARAGIQFAFPTRTVFLADDPVRPFSVQIKHDGAGQ